MDEQYELQSGWDYENEGSEFFAYAKESDWYKDWNDAVGIIESRQTGFVPLAPGFQNEVNQFVQNRWGNCCAVGAGNGVLSIINQLLALSKSNVRNAVPYYEWIWAAIRCGVQNRPGTSGATISAAMKALNDYGVLFIDDLNESDQSKLLNKNGIQINGASDWCKSMKNWKAAFAKYGDIAERYQIKTTKPNTWEDVLFALNHGCSIVYGTDIKLALKNGEYQPNGKTAHCMALYGFDADAHHTFNINSWGDGYGKLKLDIAKRQYNSRYFDCFVIYDIERIQ